MFADLNALISASGNCASNWRLDRWSLRLISQRKAGASFTLTSSVTGPACAWVTNPSKSPMAFQIASKRRGLKSGVVLDSLLGQILGHSDRKVPDRNLYPVVLTPNLSKGRLSVLPRLQKSKHIRSLPRHD